MFFSRPLLVVYKNTGGRLWNKPFGLPPLTKTQKRTRQKNVREVQKVVQTLKEAADAEPAKQHRSRPHKQLLRTCATAYEVPALQQRQREAQTETGGNGGGGWGWGGGGGGRPPQGGGGSGGQGDQDDDAAHEPIGSPFERVAVGVRTRLAADPWFWWRVAAACCVDVLAVLAVNAAAHPAEPLQRSDFVTSQVLVTLLNALVMGVATEPFSRRVRAEMVSLRLEGGLASAAASVKWPPHVAGTHPGVLAIARRLAIQGVQLGVVGLLTGCAGSAAAHQLERHRQKKDHSSGGSGGSVIGAAVVATSAAVGYSQQMQPDMQSAGAAALTAADGEQHAVTQAGQRQTEQQYREHASVLHAAVQRMVFMAVSANLRHAVLYAAEDSLGLHPAGQMRLWTARLLLHGANALLAAAQWQRMSQGTYAA